MDIQKYLPFNSVVEIDGGMYEIKGLESFAIFQINDVGILVKPVETSKINSNGNKT